MGPWPFSHGYFPAFADLLIADLPSMGPWPFSHGYYAVDNPMPIELQSFNGAMAFQPWIREERRKTMKALNDLQWGHGLSAMDTPRKWRRLPMKSGPSMGPWPFSHGYISRPTCHRPHPRSLQWGHGLSAMDTRELARPSFAHVVLQWGHGLSAMDTQTSAAARNAGRPPSMGPWPFSHGYLSAPPPPPAGKTLQWGHGLSAMDT